MTLLGGTITFVLSLAGVSALVLVLLARTAQRPADGAAGRNARLYRPAVIRRGGLAQAAEREPMLTPES
jgi:hypothetical protein